ncbi:ATP-binding protein [Acanthopleuribacter pedis]|uniref:histidine kinase n=1 Tax=Acanthopleuribacter pedis TaxID=442870 RepID=A0A8J7QBP9_9BACT|nr:ATP-binding protein [Acanthopleuribacter pedis]MBO1321507.1 HAMP domain-containing protein [Acanthopleuribacter pedis]
MSALFRRIYSAIALILIFLALIFALLIRYEVGKQVRERTESLVLPIVENAKQTLAEMGPDPVDRWLAVEELGIPDQFPTQLALRSELDLSSSETRRLEAGNLLAQQRDGEQWIYALLNQDEILVIGPMVRPELPRPPAILPFPPPVTLILILLIMGVTIFFIIRPLEKRIHQLADSAEQFGRGAWDTRTAESHQDALGDLAKTFNQMAHRIETLILGQKNLLSAVSHELRTPISRLLFAVDEGLSTADPAHKDRMLDRIENNLNEMNELIGELLTWSKLEHEDLAGQHQTLSISALFGEMAQMVHELQPKTRLTQNHENLSVRAAPRYLKRALSNLVTNAVRYGDGRIWLSAYEADQHWHISVEDNGPGIPIAERERIFDPFTRLDSSRNVALGGTGLGLSIVRRIMIRHHGMVLLEESEHGGARFVLVFPKDPPQETADTV